MPLNTLPAGASSLGRAGNPRLTSFFRFSAICLLSTNLSNVCGRYCEGFGQRLSVTLAPIYALPLPWMPFSTLYLVYP